MSIGLNYTHEKAVNGILLPSYAYILNKYHPIMRAKLFAGDAHETKKFSYYLEAGYVQEALHSQDADQYFDGRWIREILAEAYPYEVSMKCMGETIENDGERNQRLITYFNHFFTFHYEDVLATYIATADHEIGKKEYVEPTACTYSNTVSAVYQYLSFIDTLLRSQGYEKEADWHAEFADKKLRVRTTPGISGVTTERGDGTIIIEVGNNTCTTLFHELAHFTNRVFRYHYYENYEVCFDNYTKTNEGFANFVAYHLQEQILSGDISSLESIRTDSLFFSFYIDIYALLRQRGSTDRIHNFSLIESSLQHYLGELWTSEKNDFYIQRFYKFFHYDQHEYFYPKEMMYHLGYHAFREMFEKSNDTGQLLTECFLGKICLS